MYKCNMYIFEYAYYLSCICTYYFFVYTCIPNAAHMSCSVYPIPDLSGARCHDSNGLAMCLWERVWVVAGGCLYIIPGSTRSCDAKMDLKSDMVGVIENARWGGFKHPTLYILYLCFCLWTNSISHCHVCSQFTGESSAPGWISPVQAGGDRLRRKFPLGVKWARAMNSGMWRLRCWKGVKGVQARRWIGTDCTYVYDSMIIWLYMDPFKHTVHYT